MANRSLMTRFVPIRPAPSRSPPPSTLPAPPPHSLDSRSPPAITRFDNNLTPDTRHHVDPDLSVLYTHSLFDPSFVGPLFDTRPPIHHALATTSSPQVRTQHNHAPVLNLPRSLPPTPRTTSHTPRSPDQHTFARPRLPVAKSIPPVSTSATASTLSPNYLDNYLNMLSTPQPSESPVADVAMWTDHEAQELSKLLQTVGQPEPMSYRTIEELLTSPEFPSPLFEDTPNLSDQSPFESAEALRHLTSPALIDYDSGSGGIPLFGSTTPNLALDHLLTLSATESPATPAIDTSQLFPPLFDSPGTRPGTTTKKSPTGHRKNLSPNQLLPVDAPTQQRTYHGPSATSRKAIPAGFEDKKAKLLAKSRRGVQAGEPIPTEEEVMSSAIDSKRRANTIAARRSRQRKLETVQRLEQELQEAKAEAEMWRARAIAAEKMLDERKQV